MSQHWFESDNKKILAGWDNPLGRFFFSVFKKEEDLQSPDEDDHIYNYMFDPEAVNDLGQMLLKMSRMGIEIPRDLPAKLNEDMENNR